MATQTYGISASRRATIGGTMSSAPTTATLVNTHTTSSTNDTTTISGTLTLTVNVAKGSGHTVTCGASIDNAKVLVNGTARVNVNDRGVSVTSSLSSAQSNSITLGTYSVPISRTHAAQSISVRLEQTGLTARNWYPETLDSAGKTSTVTVPARPSYTVSYAANGGSSTPTAQTKWYGEAIALRGAISRTGYTFAGWKWSGNNTVYGASTSWNAANASGTMTAQWTANTYLVKYNANGGSGTMSSSTHTYDTAKALTTNAFTRSKYLFKGWATTASGGVVYTNGQSVKNLTTTKNGTVNLYAVWEYQYKKPTFSKLTAWRTKDTATGGVYEKDDSGTNADISVTLNAGQKKSTANDSFANISTTVQFFYKAHSASSYPSTPFRTQTTTATGATLTAHISDQLNIETQYDIKVVAYITESSADSASYTTFVSTAFFLVDMTDTGVAFGQASTRNAVESNMHVYLENEKTIYPIIHRKKAGGGGWAYNPMRLLGDDLQGFASLGVYGSADTLNYMYVGANSFDGDNLRIYNDGSIRASAVYAGENRLLPIRLINIFVNHAYKGTAANTWQYIGKSFTVPAGHAYLVFLTAAWNTGRPTGIGLNSTNGTISTSPDLGYVENDNGLANRTPMLYVSNGTYYVYCKRATVPTTTNNHSAYAIDIITG